MHAINQQVNFVSATASGDDSILITSSVQGDPFELFGVSSSSSSGSIIKSSDSHPSNLPPSETNDAEEKTITLSLRDSSGKETGTPINVGDSITVYVNGVNVTYTVTSSDLASAMAVFTDPLAYEQSALFMLSKLKNGMDYLQQIGSISAQAEYPAVESGVGASMLIRSTERGAPLIFPFN